MRKLSFLLISLIIISCGEHKKEAGSQVKPSNRDTATTNSAAQPGNCSNWVDNFREFRNAVYANNRSRVRDFIDFPVMNANNEIWYLVYTGDKRIRQLPDTIKPFTEQDFDKYFDKLFSKRFINTILKIKSEDLYKKGEVETIEFKESSNTIYKMYATFNKKECTLILNLFSDSVIKDEKGEVQDGGEYSVIYEFVVLKNGQIKFKQVGLAG
jgi:hypothetical protein